RAPLLEEAYSRGDVAYALDAWRWVPEREATGDIVGLRFRGERLGDDRVLFEAIAPFVEPGSFIEMVGEDGAIWRWTFGPAGLDLFVIQHCYDGGPRWLCRPTAPGCHGSVVEEARPGWEGDPDAWRGA